MPTLHNTTEETKTILRWIGVFAVSLIVIIVLFRIGKALKDYFFPTPPPPPTVAFGKLPAIDFPQSVDTKKFTYSINTLTGSLPVLAITEPVYKTSDFEPNLLNLERAESKVAQVGFTTPAVKNTDNLYIWQSPPVGNYYYNRKIVLDISNYNFDLTSDYLTSQTLLSSPLIPDLAKSITTAKTYLEKVGVMPGDIDTTKTEAIAYSIINGNLIKATSLSKAQIVKVAFRQRDVSKLPVVYPNPPLSTMTFTTAWEGSPPQIATARFFHESLTEISATYPIKSAQAAYEDLKNGNAYIASNENETNQIAINNVYLAYFAADKPQQYFMPVVVFEGSHNFVAYVSAVNPLWIK